MSSTKSRPVKPDYSLFLVTRLADTSKKIKLNFAYDGHTTKLQNYASEKNRRAANLNETRTWHFLTYSRCAHAISEKPVTGAGQSAVLRAAFHRNFDVGLVNTE